MVWYGIVCNVMLCYVMYVLYVCLSVCMYVGRYVRTYVCMCLCVCMCVCAWVCVYHLNRCKTSNLAGGHRAPGGVGDQRRHLPGTRANVPAGLWWRTWAHLSRSWWPP